MITIKDLDFHYSRKRQVYKNLNLSIPKGAITVILGLNGAGKTTMLNLIAGFLIPKEGTCKVSGYDSSKRFPEMLQELFMVSDISEFPNMNIENFCKLYADFYKKFDYELFAHCLTEFHLTEKQSLKHISLGEKRKVMLAFALATRCNVLLFDEPTNGLDIPSKATFRKLVASNVGDNQTILIATHQVRDLSNLMDRIVIEHQGKIIINETIDRISEKLAFGKEAEEVNSEDLILFQEDIALKQYVAVNRNGHSSNLDLELLFNAATANPIKLSSVFND